MTLELPSFRFTPGVIGCYTLYLPLMCSDSLHCWINIFYVYALFSYVVAPDVREITLKLSGLKFTLDG